MISLAGLYIYIYMLYDDLCVCVQDKGGGNGLMITFFPPEQKKKNVENEELTVYLSWVFLSHFVVGG
jgi:hypothetical protein